MFKLGLILGGFNSIVLSAIVLKALQIKEIKRTEKVWYYFFILSGIYGAGTIGVVLQEMENF